MINGEVGAQHEGNLRHLAMNSTRAANRGLPQGPRFARVTAAVPANLPLGGASSSSITALSTTIEVFKAGTGWQAAPAAGARTTSNDRARNANRRREHRGSLRRSRAYALRAFNRLR